jgi:transposase
MTQVLSVSATTAGYVTDTLRPVQRGTRSPYVEQINQQIETKKDIAKTEGISRSAIATLKDSTAIGLHFMKAGEQRHPRASLEETKQAYRDAEELANELS